MLQSNLPRDIYKSSNQRFEFLDGLRGIAAMLVVLFHFNNIMIKDGITPFPKFINWILSQGVFGVEIFFILSGFVIAYSIRNKRVSLGFVGNFFIQRSIRLDPPYWIALSVLIAHPLLVNLVKTNPMPVFTFKEIWVNWFYLSDLMDVHRILPVAWTLAFEIQFYMFFVLLVFFFQYLNSKFSKVNTTSSMSTPVLYIVTGLMLISLLQNTPYAIFPAIQGLFITRWYSFFIGCLACWSMLNLVPSVFFWINFSLVGLFALTQNTISFETCLISGVIYGVAIKEKMHSFLTSITFQYLGKISYSLYLVHWIVVIFMDIFLSYTNIFHSSGGSSLLLVAATAASIFAADIFYRVIEYPSLWLSRQFRNRSKQPVTQAKAQCH